MIVAICAPIFVLMCFEAQRPKAADPPALFISDTIEPKTTRNTMMPTFHGSDRQEIRPYCLASAPVPTVSLSKWVKKPSKPVPIDMLYNIAPSTMPMNNEEYTSLVFSASAMATTGGRRDQIVPMKLKSIILLSLNLFRSAKVRLYLDCCKKLQQKNGWRAVCGLPSVLSVMLASLVGDALSYS